MSVSDDAVQCIDPNCAHPLNHSVEGQCQRCMRPLHDTCGSLADDEVSEEGRLCSACADAEDGKGPGPAKRRRLDLSEKVRALDMLRNGSTPQQVADEFGSSKRAIMRMKKEGHIIRSLSEGGAKGSMKSRKQSNPSKFAALEAEVIRVLNASQGNRISITNEFVRSCTRKVRDEMLKDPNLGANRAKDLRTFIPTDVWIKAFSRRNNLKVTGRQWPEAGSSNEDRFLPDLQNLRNDLQRYDPECILSVYETTLFYKVLPRSVYVMPDVNASGTGTKVFPPGMETKDRLTLVFCTNSTGSFKVPLAMVGKQKRPHCFRTKASPLHYLSQLNAWFDVHVFKEWFSEVLLPAVRAHSWKNVALLVENMGEEKIAEDVSGQVRLFRLPADPRARRHPMQQGVVDAVKHKYRYIMLERVIELFGVRDAPLERSRGVNPAQLGLDDGCDANELDAAEILHTIWRGTSEQCIARSWVKSGVLPDAFNAAMVTRHGNSQAFGRADMLLETCTVSEKETIDRMNVLIRSRTLRSHDGSSEGLKEIVGAINSMNEGDLETWLGLEESPDIRSALLREAPELLLKTTARMTQAAKLGPRLLLPANGHIVQQDPHESTSVPNLPSVATIAKMFVPIEDMVAACNANGAALHIRQAKRLLFAARIKEERSAVYQSSRIQPFGPLPP